MSEKAFVKAMEIMSPLVRASASALTNAGRSLAVLPPPGGPPTPSTMTVSLTEDQKPSIGKAFLAPTATLEGMVRVHDAASVWYGATVKGSGANGVSIGSGSIVSDNVSIFGEISIEEDTLIGPNSALLDVSVISQGAVIEPGVTVHRGASIGAEARIGTGSTVAPNTVIGPSEYWAGSPATFQRALSEAEIASAKAEIIELRELSLVHAQECSKDYLQIMHDLEEEEDRQHRHPDYFQRDLHPDSDVHKGVAIPGRIMNSVLRKN